MTLVQDGQPAATIVVVPEALTAEPEPKFESLWAPQPSANKIAAAARDLQRYIEKISGAKLPIVSDEREPETPILLVGKSRLTLALDDKIPSGLTPLRREEGYILHCKSNRLLLAGNDEGPYHGTEYAVAEFLEGLGVRWYMPGDYGEIIPRQKTIKINTLEIRGKPDFIVRNGWGPKSNELHLLHYRWKIRNRMNPVLHILSMPADNSTWFLLPEGKIKENLALCGKHLNGNPYLGMPNLSNPDTVQLFAEGIKAAFRRDPATTSYGFAPDDGLPRDWTPETVKRNRGFPDIVGRSGVPAELSVSEEWFGFVNQVVREVKKEFPDHLIGTNGYANRNTPPVGIQLEKNLYVMFAAIWSDTLHAYDDPTKWQTYRQGQLLKRWTELCSNVYVYNYIYIMLASAGTPVPLTRKLVRDFPLMKKWGVIGFSDEGRSVLAESGIHCQYLRARLEWDADLNVSALLDDFFRRWYGAAARPAQAFWNALELTMEKTPMLGHEDRILPYVYSSELISELEKHIKEASRLADTPDTQIHVQADHSILEHLKAYMAMTQAEWDADFPLAVQQADRMLLQRKKLSELSLFYCQPDDADLTSGFYYWGVVERKNYYQKLADLTTGKTGDLIRKLPASARVQLDPRDEGRFSHWYDPEYSDRDWHMALTTKPFYIQIPGCLDETSYPVMGPLWYRLKFSVPSSAEGKKIMLYAPTVETEAWVWVNGQFVGHRPYHEAYERPSGFDMDVTPAIRPGRANLIAVRVHTGLNAAQAAGGFYSRLFLYSPKPQEPK